MSRVVPAILSVVVVGVVIATRKKIPKPPATTETKPPVTTPPDTTAPDVTTTAPLRPPPRPGIILTAPVVTAPPPDSGPKLGTACTIRTGGGCFVYPDHVIDPTQPVRANTENIQANAFRVPFGGQVEILSGPVRIDVVPAGKAEVFYYTPRPTGALTVYRIRFCQPGTTTCRVGWISESSLR